MWGFIGFLFATALFFAYAVSLRKLLYLSAHVRTYASAAYGLLSLASLTWAFASIGGDELIHTLIAVGNVLLGAATVMLVNATLGKKYQPYTLAIGFALTGVLLALRFTKYPSTAYTENGVLLFHEPTMVTGVLLFAFLLVWLPANFSLGRRIVSVPHVRMFRSVISICYIFAALSVGLLLVARKPQVAALAFVMLCSSYTGLLMINRLALRGANHG